MNLRLKADDIRRRTYSAIYNAGGGHYGGSLSSIEILTCLYFAAMKLKQGDAKWSGRDRFILSKGHAGPPLYIILSDLGFIDPNRINELDQDGGSLPKHVDRCMVDGVDFSSGPLGQGLSVACGIASAAKMDGSSITTYILMGDGELNEGQIWEAAMTASHYKLGNMIAFIDRNFNQIDGTTENVMALEPLDQKWKSFGWNVQEIDGHSVTEIMGAISEAKDHVNTPSVIIARTTKGKGISFMEDNYLWHSGQISNDQFQLGLSELKGG